MQVREFQEAFSVELPERPKLLTKKRAELRQSLLEEEVSEIYVGVKSKDITQIADGVIDCMYILIGTAHEYGFADRLVLLFDEVHKSNMSKVGPDGKAIFREDGKVMKPESYKPPKLARILQRDFSLYKENEIIKEIAEMEMKANENRIRKTISNKLNIFDRILFNLYDKIESRLNKKVNVTFPQKVTDSIVVEVYGKTYEL